jgi:penicillin-binding protein 1A
MPKDTGRRQEGPGRRSAEPVRKPLWRRTLRVIMIWGGALAILAVIFLGTAVLMTARELPSFSSLQSSQNGQMIVVRARDGTELVSLGPSYGQWLGTEQIPQVMKDAIVSVEDRRFRSHWGVDPIGVARPKDSTSAIGSRMQNTRVKRFGKNRKPLGSGVFLIRSMPPCALAMSIRTRSTVACWISVIRPSASASA